MNLLFVLILSIVGPNSALTLSAVSLGFSITLSADWMNFLITLSTVWIEYSVNRYGLLGLNSLLLILSTV